jgi:hypothetical protein
VGALVNESYRAIEGALLWERFVRLPLKECYCENTTVLAHFWERYCGSNIEGALLREHYSGRTIV